MKLVEMPGPDGRLTIILEVSTYDMVSCDLTPMDFLLNAECAKSNSISDKLLWLETLARRIEEKHKP